MKRLFFVRDTKTGKRLTMEGAGSSPDFDRKMKAKELRDVMNGDGGTRFVISRGVDHMGKHGHTIARMRLQPKLWE